MMQTAPMLSRRYLVQEPLGEGGMGVVYRAYDRLTGQAVALKRIRVQGSSPGLMETHEDGGLFRMATEFRTMVGLIHPHIVRVLSYGFANNARGQREPYFTMELIDQAQTILDYATDLDAAGRLRVLVEMLEALEYLHRRGILHRDLKPGNVLVNREGHVKVMDFGLAMNTRSTAGEMRQMVVGTLSYMAPEVLMGEPSTVAADLYAVGILAYEMFVGKHPYYSDNASVLMMNVLHAQPNVDALPPALGAVIAQMLAKAPADRYASARAMIHALYHALGHPIPREDAALQESYLKGARFVGRHTELSRLRRALAALMEDGTGGLWLIGGASGVGKSRLLEEVRTRALVTGATVIRGWVAEQSGQPNSLWRNPIQRLALYTEMSDAEAGVLKSIVPDIGRLLGRDVPDVPPLENPGQQRRLEQTLIAVLRRQSEPVVLLLDDLQWAQEDLELLRAVMPVLDQLMLLIVACYRDDEAPTLPTAFLQAFPATQVITLGRLDDEAIVELCEAIAGEAGRRQDVLALLRRESEGNVFFLIEAMRALAQEAGGLSEIGRQALPERVFTRGVQSVIQRRLQVLRLDDHPMLRLSAVIGRTIDLRLLRALDDETDYAGWLRRCEAASVLAVEQYDQWTFVHDKYREGILYDLLPGERPRLHRLAAELIEQVYAGDPSYAAALADHWHAAGEPERELHHLMIAAETTFSHSADYPRTLALLRRTLALVESRPGHAGEQMRLHAMYGRVCLRTGDLPDAHTHYARSLALAQALGDDEGRAAALLGSGQTHFQQGSFDDAATLAHTCLALFRDQHNAEGEAQSLGLLGAVSHSQGDYLTARAQYEESIALYQTVNALYGVAATLLRLANTMIAQGDYASAEQANQRALALHRQLNDQWGISYSYGNLGLVAYHLGQYTEAQAFMSQQLEITRDMGDQQGFAYSLGNLAMIAHIQDDFPTAEAHLEQCIEITRRIEDRWGTAYNLHRLSEVRYSQHDYAGALGLVNESCTLFEALMNPEGIANALVTRSFIYFLLGDTETARRDLRSGLEHAAAIGGSPLMLEVIVGYARLALAEGDAQQAAELLGQANRHPRMSLRLFDLHVAPLLADLEQALPADFLEKSLKRGKSLELESLIWALLQVGA